MNSETILLDRYEVGELLGQGGMGTVYKGTDILLERSVAVKLLSARGLGTEGKARMLREARSAAGLNHPNIVAVYDAGEADLGDRDPTPFVIMELVKGRNLSEAAPLPLVEVIDIGGQLCSALEQAHNSGIIHRDLKPENVLLNDQGLAKLVDFGLARSAATRLTVEGTIAGTLSYLPPELLLGQDFDGRSDLYSLGVMLYELSAGQLPFTAEDPVAVITQHLHAPVVPPSVHNPEIPAAFDNLILKLLEKDPAKRPGSAGEVRDRLELIALNEAGAEQDKEVTLLDRIVRGHLVGREEELAEIRTLWRKAAAGQGQTLLISGEPGIGKSSLLRELITQVEVTGGTAMVGECYAEGSAPYAPFAQIFSQALQKNGLRDGQGSSRGVDLPDFVLADLIMAAPELRIDYPEVPTNPTLDPQSEQRRLFENVVVLLKALCEKGALLVTLEGAHWADSASLALLRHLARRSKDLPVMLAATYRESAFDKNQGFNQVAADLMRERLALTIHLTRFSREDTEKMLSVLFAEEITPEFLEGIYRKTEGNPYFIEEICKTLVDSGQVYYEDGAWYRPSMAEIAMPEGIQAAIQSRVSKLPEEHQELLRLAAFLGREFNFDTLSELSELDQGSLINALEDSERSQLIESTGGIDFRFTHNLIPAALIESTHGLRRRLIHQRVAQAIEKMHPEEVTALANHYYEAGDTKKALQYFSQAGERAQKAFANEEAAAYFESALNMVEDLDQKANLLLQQAQVISRLGRNEEAISVWHDAIQLFKEMKDLDQVALVYSMSSRAAWEGGDPKRGLVIAREGIDAAAGATEGPGLAELYHEFARALFFNGEIDEGTDVIEQAAAMAERVGAVRVQAESLISLGSFAKVAPDKRTSYLEQAITLAGEYQLLDQEARARNNICVNYGFGLGRFEDALEQSKIATKLARKTGTLSHELFYSANTAFYRAVLGELKPAKEHLSSLWDLTREIGENTAGERMLRAYEASINRYLGRRKQALERLLEIHRDAFAVKDSNISWASALFSTELVLEIGSDYEQAEEALKNALEISYGGDGWPLCMLASIKARQHKLEESREYLDSAIEFVTEEGQLTDQLWVSFAGAELAKAQQNNEAAVDALRQAVELAGQFKMRWYRAYAMLQLAMLQTQDANNDEVRELLEDARDEFNEMGAAVYVDEINEMLAG